MTTIIILTTIYILSAICWWLFVHYLTANPPNWAVVVTFIPVINTLVLLIALFGVTHEFISNIIDDKINANKFFKIKK